MRTHNTVLAMARGDAQINGIPLFHMALNAEQDFIEATGPQPDPGWKHTDGFGHFHTWTADGKLPTLELHNEWVSCDGDECVTHPRSGCLGGGFMRTIHCCVLCELPVEPGYRDAGICARPEMFGETVYTADCHGPAELADLNGSRVSLSWVGGFAMGDLHVGGMSLGGSAPDAVQCSITRMSKPFTTLGHAALSWRPVRVDVGAAIEAAAQALEPSDFHRLAARVAVTAALPKLGIGPDGAVLR